MITLTLSLIQVNDCVIGPGSPTFDNAYWEVTYVKTYVAAGSQPSSPNGTSAGGTIASGTTTAGAGSSTGTANSSPAFASVLKWYGLSVGVSVSVVLMFAGLIPAVLA